MIDIWKDQSFRRGKLLLLPLLNLEGNFEVYLKWSLYSIRDYYLILRSKEILDKDISNLSSRLVEIHFDDEDYYICIIDLSEWKEDIDKIMNGKYTEVSKSSKINILNYYKEREEGIVPDQIYASILPDGLLLGFSHNTYRHFISEEYDIKFEDIKKSELCKPPSIELEELKE